MKKTGIFSLIILLNSPLAWPEVVNIVVVGLFNDQAVVEINKTRRLLKVGEPSPEGVTLISANSRGAVLEENGTRKEYLLGTHIGTDFKSSSAQKTVNLWPTNGMYSTLGTVNGYSVDFLVDTGASSIVLNAETATRLDINYLKGNKISITTASGDDLAYSIMLDTVQVGTIKLHNISAMVIDGNEPAQALLGMSFLNQLDIERKDQQMILKQKY